MIKKARVIYNPSSGREEAKKFLPDILNCLENMGYEASAFATKGKGDATREASRVAEERFDLIISVGGDGTVYEIINGLGEKEFRPKLGILPMGTSNDFAKALGIPKSIPKALEIFKKEQTKSVDIGKMNKRYFINVAGGGSLTELTYEVPSKLKTSLGQLAYYIKGAEKLATFRPFTVEMTVDDELIKEEVMLFLIVNSHIVAGFEKLAPHAKVDDGLFDIFLLKKCNVAELARVTSALLKGEHIYDPKMIHLTGKNVSVRATKNAQINLDGELGGIAPCEFEVLPHHIEVIIGKNKTHFKK